MNIPEFLPVLASGPHSDPKQGACVMEYVSLLAGESWSDRPSCTHPVLAEVARVTNDCLPDAERQQLVPLIPRLFGTPSTGADWERRVLNVRLAVWCAKRVLHLSGGAEAVALAAIRAAEQWADSPSDATAKAAYAANAAAYAANAAAYAAKAAAYAAKAAYAANAAAYAAKAAAYAAKAAAYAAKARVQFLTELIDEYDRLTGRDQYPEVDLTALADTYQELIGEARR